MVLTQPLERRPLETLETSSADPPAHQMADTRYARSTTTIVDTISHPIAASNPLSSSRSIILRSGFWHATQVLPD
jgi:hypothetical protein